MGLSGRFNFNFKNQDDCLDYYVDKIEKLVNKLNLNKFHLIGNSLGGLISCLYAIKHPDKIVNLFLTSPAGISDTVLNENDIE